MIGIIFSTEDVASSNIANSIIEKSSFAAYGNAKWKKGEIEVVQLHTPLLSAEQLNYSGYEILYMLSKHSSAAGIPAFTTHSTGNWLDEAKLGGMPRQLSFAAPLQMLSVLRKMSGISSSIGATYEATHHGPLLRIPSLFVELGGNENIVNDKALAEKLGDAIISSINVLKDGLLDYSCVAIGIGGTHYPSKFTRLALEKGYAFSHIMPKYAVDGGLSILDQAMERSAIKPEKAVIEWKSINAVARENVIVKLNELGIDYEKI
ncbi:MAG: D-aminoacyl-tRNA deacylase [Candidatus Micrarchaeaceae archaeon]